MEQKTRFGPAGSSDRFHEEGYKSSVDAPRWLAAQGLTAFEYAAGRGVALSEATARAIGSAAASLDVAMSIHAPYYINCASPEPEKREKAELYLLDAARAVGFMGGERVVFHVGSPGKLRRAEANRLARQTVAQARKRLDAEGLRHIFLCPETMGRASQLGTLEETLQLCLSDERLIPTLDFGHLHAIGQGALNTAGDFRRVLDALLKTLGEARARAFHAHFSRLEFTNKGEKRHVTFADEGYGPDFALLAPLLVEYDLTPTIICESRGTQSDDALAMKALYERALDA